MPEQQALVLALHVPAVQARVQHVPAVQALVSALHVPAMQLRPPPPKKLLKESQALWNPAALLPQTLSTAQSEPLLHLLLMAVVLR
jgi:hypothetical protein